MGMKLGFIGNNSLADVESDAKFAAEHGFAALEYNYWANFRDLKLETVQQMRKILDAHGVAVSSLGLWPTRTFFSKGEGAAPLDDRLESRADGEIGVKGRCSI